MAHYEVLGLEIGASAAEIKAAYHQAALKHHPDKSADAESQQSFQAVQAAWQVPPRAEALSRSCWLPAACAAPTPVLRRPRCCATPPAGPRTTGSCSRRR
jgi:hypothetical protein